MSIMRHARMYLLFCLFCRLELDRKDTQISSTEDNTLSPTVVFVTANRPLTPEGEKPISIPVDPVNLRMNSHAYEESRVLLRDHQVNIADQNLSAEIQQEIVNSVQTPQAQSIKVMTQRGVVTLRGTVSAEVVKERIEDVAARIVDHFPYDIDNQLDIRHPQ